jgi:hypothetical protein
VYFSSCAGVCLGDTVDGWMGNRLYAKYSLPLRVVLSALHRKRDFTPSIFFL